MQHTWENAVLEQAPSACAGIQLSSHLVPPASSALPVKIPKAQPPVQQSITGFQLLGPPRSLIDSSARKTLLCYASCRRSKR